MRRIFSHLVILLALGVLGLPGCRVVDRSPRLADYLDELEFDVPLESASYVTLGKYDIPIAATRRTEAEAARGAEPLPAEAVMMRLQFELTAETAPPYEKKVAEAAERHRGALNDAVLTTVRTSTVEELSDPRLAAVKARLSEITRPMLGEDMVRQLVLNRVDAEQMSEKGMKKAEGEHAKH
jgi:hypothetical protein